MNKKRVVHIILGLLAVFAAAVLFITYGTVLPSAPFSSIQLNRPTSASSDGKMTVVSDSESRRALIMNADGYMTGVISCTTVDSPIDAITDVCIADNLVYVAGVRFAPDSDVITQERIVTYDKGGNQKGVIAEQPGSENVLPSIKSVKSSAEGIVVAYSNNTSSTKAESSSEDGMVNYLLIDKAWETHPLEKLDPGSLTARDAAFSDGESKHYATLDVRGALGGNSEYATQIYAGHTFTSIALDDDGILYACDDETNSLCAITPGSPDVRTVIQGEKYYNVHVEDNVVTLCNSEENKVTLCDTQGNVQKEFTEVIPSTGFSARMLLVWACGLYLVILILVLAIRKLYRQIKAGKTEGIGPMLLALAVVSAVAIAIGTLSFSSYQKSLEQRANEINMCADYLDTCSSELSASMETINDRDKMHGDEEGLIQNIIDLINASKPALLLTNAASNNHIGMYCTIYGRDDKGIFYLFGSSIEYVLGTSAHTSGNDELVAAFESEYSTGGKLISGHTLRDATQYRLVKIPSSDGKSVAGVIEIGSKTRSFAVSITGDLAQRVLALLVMVLAVYLAYTELRACGRCIFSYRERQKTDITAAVAELTRPFTLAITTLTSIDSVMTVLIARDLLTQAGAESSSPLLGVPAVMLGIGLVLGQTIYGFAGSRVGLRKLMLTGSLAMLLFACLTGLAVASGNFWLYCAAKLTLSIPFGMLYTLGYSLPRLTHDEEVRAKAAGGVRRTDNSAAALGMVLGGYAAQLLGNIWVYAFVAIACLPVIFMVVNLLPHSMKPLEKLAQPDSKNGLIRDMLKNTPALAIAMLIILPATIAAGYASFLFPLFSSDLGMTKADVNNIVVMGQLVVFVCINQIDRVEARHGKWKASTSAIALLGVVFLLFSVNTTLAWSTAVIALVGLLGKTSDGWKAMWLRSANEADVPAGRAVGAMYTTRSLALVAQPFILSSLLGTTDKFAVIVIGVICLICAGLFFLITKRTFLNKM